MGYIEALEAKPPRDAKGYTTDKTQKWKYPPLHMPPPGKLHLLTEGGISTHGEWRWDGGFLGFRELFARDLEEEAKARAFVTREKEKVDAKKRVDKGGRPQGADRRVGMESQVSSGRRRQDLQDYFTWADDGGAHGDAVLPY